MLEMMKKEEERWEREEGRVPTVLTTVLNSPKMKLFTKRVLFSHKVSARKVLTIF